MRALSSVVDKGFEKSFDDVGWMREAIAAAEFASVELDEIPIGACVVSGAGELLAKAGNRTRTHCDPTAHAEIIALREAAKAIGNYRLVGAKYQSLAESEQHSAREICSTLSASESKFIAYPAILAGL